jgi:hypothetical protein
MPGWSGVAQALPAARTFLDFHEAADGRLADAVLDSFAAQLGASEPAARNAFLEAVVERVADPIERATLIARLTSLGAGGSVPVQVRVPRNLAVRLDARAVSDGVTRSDVIREGIELMLARYKLRGGIRHPLFHFRWTDRPGRPTAAWEQIRGTPGEIRRQRAELRARLGEAAAIEEALFFERSRVRLWTVIGVDGKTDERRWDRVRPETIDDVLIDAETEPGITVACA